MKHRHLRHEKFTLAAIEDIFDRGRMSDWVPLIGAIRADPFGEVAEKTRLLCERPLYGAPVFRRVIANARGPGNLLADATTEILLDTGAVSTSIPSPAGVYQERTALVGEIRWEGIEL